ncbi:hypothetical protein LCGC14_0674130 [marine sediment metagenome]|uniref:Uncharacterized protein n=1 Tax=marine sediment metagenome TaxID=412755 RepID=A0A0F9TBL6_9ZZZZ
MTHIYHVRKDGALGIAWKRFVISGADSKEIRAKWKAINTPYKWETLRVDRFPLCAGNDSS